MSQSPGSLPPRETADASPTRAVSLTVDSVTDGGRPGLVRLNGAYDVEPDVLAKMRASGMPEYQLVIACLEEHYRRRLMEASSEAERSALYAEGYEDLSRHYHAYGQIEHGASDALFRLVRPWFSGKRVLEIGCGNGTMAAALAPVVARYVGIDASAVAVDYARGRLAGVEHVELRCGSLPAALRDCDGTYDVVYSNDFLEHLHIDDLNETLRQCRRLIPTGRGTLVLVMPNRLFGPFDLSRAYVPRGRPARCFHLSETTYGEMIRLLAAHGFTQTRSPLGPLAAYLVSRRLPFLGSALLAPAWIKSLAEHTGPLRNLLRRPVGLSGVILSAR